MKSILKIFFLLFISLFSNDMYSLSNTKILEICKKEINKKSCIKELKEKRSDLKEGNPIEIEVIPFKE